MATHQAAAIGSQGLFPWQYDPAVSNAWIADPRHLTIATGVSAWAPTKGNIFLTQPTAAVQPAFTSNFGVRNRGCLTFDGTNDYLMGDAFAALLNGTSLPLSFCLSLQPTVLQVGHLVSFGRSIATPSPNGPYFVLYVSHVTGKVAVTRNTTANVGAQGETTQVLSAANRVVITQLYNGTNCALRFNGVATSVTAQALGGLMTLDKFVMGASAVVSGYANTPAAIKVRAFVAGPSLWNAATYTAIENYLMNE